MIQFSCLQCGMKLKVKDEHAGKSSKCPTCKQPLKVPEPNPIQVVVPSGKIDGAASLLERAGIDVGITLPPSPTAPVSQPKSSIQPKQKSVPELLSNQEGLGSRYVLGEEIARGGMGAVLRGIDRDIRREVAIKFMLNDTDAKQKARFIEEAQITGQLEHPNIVPVHELGVDAQKRLFFTMKMVRGRSLAQILEGLQSSPETEREWSLSRLLIMLVNVCHALAYAHSRNVIHRDLKPANIMVGDFGEVYVMDWGLAKVLGARTPERAPPTLVKQSESTDIQSAPSAHGLSAHSLSGSSLKEVATNPRVDGDLTQEGAILGTPAYMPPEQASGDVGALDQRSDIYSLGAILYALLTLQAPIEKDGNFLALLVRVVEGDIKKPEQRTPQRARQGLIPPELSAIAMKGLAKEPRDRYQTVEAFRGDLERFLEGRSVSAKEDTKREMMTKFVKRNKGFSAATGTALVVLLTVVSFFLRINYTARLHAEEQERQAVQSKVDFEQSQREKDQAVRDSLPAFVGAGRQLANEGKFPEAQKQAEVALVYDPQNAAAHLLKGQILLAQKDWAQARAELRLYLQRQPQDEQAKALLNLSQKDMQDPAVLFAITEVLGSQNLYGLTGALTKDIEIGVATRKPFLKQYQDRINASLPGLGILLSLQANGQFSVNFQDHKQVLSLDPLRGMRLHKVAVARCSNIADLEPLRGMPLTFLDISSCTKIENLRALQKMPLATLEISNLDKLVDLEPLRGMPLERLRMIRCLNATDLAPLTGMPLVHLDLTSCGELTDLRPLKGLSLLQELYLASCIKVSDLESLRGLPLQTLWMSHTTVRSLEPLRRMPLRTLDLGATVIQDLGPLKGMPIANLTVWGCPKISDLSPLEGMPLKSISLTPKYIQKGMDVLRDMETLKTIAVDLEAFPADVFWKRYDAGEFRK